MNLVLLVLWSGASGWCWGKWGSLLVGPKFLPWFIGLLVLCCFNGYLGSLI
jgi:hypothetical protein